MAYQIGANKVFSERVEIMGSDNCNLTCLSCDHLAPVSTPQKKQLTSVEKIAEDLSALSTAYHARTARILGGEPLLRLDLLDLAKAVKQSGIADTLRIVTNGTLLHRISDDLLDVLDSVEISFYPQKFPSHEELHALKSRCEARGVILCGRRIDSFRISHSNIGTKDESLVHRIYQACRKAHQVGCQTVYAGHFFKCSVAHALDREMLRNGSYPSGVALFPIEGLYERITSYLSEEKGPLACQFCLGVVGQRIPHSQSTRKEWMSVHSRSVEELVDWDFLRSLEDNPSSHWLISQPVDEDYGIPLRNGID